MPPVVWWIGLLALALVAAVLGIRFRRGNSPRSLAMYRSSESPAALRNLPVLWPLAVIGVVAMLLVNAPDALGLNLPFDVPRRIGGVLLALLYSTFLGATGLACVLGARPPEAVKPRWLREDDLRVGYVQRRLDLLDRGLLGFGIAALVFSVGVLAAGIGVLLGLISV